MITLLPGGWLSVDGEHRRAMAWLVRGTGLAGVTRYREKLSRQLLDAMNGVAR